MQTQKSTAFRLLAVLIIAAMIFGVIPATSAKAATPAQTLYVANWTVPASVGVNGRPIVIKDGGTYHLWYGASDTALYYTTSTVPSSFGAGTLVVFDPLHTPVEVGSPAIIQEGGTFYMVAYGNTNTKFALYTSGNGINWTYIKDVLDCSTITSDFFKVDAPFLFYDEGTYRLYFQLKSADKTNYKIYTAETTTSISNAGFGFTVANSGNPVLIPGAAGSWDSNFVMHPWVIKDNGVYYMYYSAYGSSQVIGMAKSADGYNWVKSPANPILGPVGEPAVINDSGVWRMWYLGSGNTVMYFSSTGTIEFSSIQAAITKATGGETISVANGTYNEKLIINKPNLTIKSVNGSTPTIIDVPDGSLTTGVKISGTNLGVITFDGFTVKDFTEGGIIQGMGSAAGTTSHVLNNIVIPAGNYLRNGIQVSGNNSTVIGNYVRGAHLTADWSGTGILAAEGSHIRVENNTVDGDGYGMDAAIAISRWYAGSLVDTIIRNNTILKAEYALSLTTYDVASIIDGVVFENNKITEYTVGVDAYNNGLIQNVDASPNWWGSASGPKSDSIMLDGTIFAPWCADEACKTFAPTDGKIILPEGVTPAEIQAAINNAPENTTIVIPSGTYQNSGGFEINTPHLTILLKNGTVIRNASPCFIINADYTQITAETLGNAKCVPTNGSNGIDVADGLKDIRIIGLEIDGTDATGSGDGIHFTGAVSDVLIDDNIIHDLDGNGINFTAAPTSTVEIKGNFIKGNALRGVAAPADLDVKYNSWGKMTGPVSGTDVSAVITSFAPFTHAELSLVSSGTPWTDRVLPGNTVTYTVYADFQSVMGADFKLDYPASLTLGSVTNVTTAFQPVPAASLVNTSTAGVISFAGYTKTAVSGHVALFDVTFTAPATGGVLDLNLDETSSIFVMSPGYGASNNIYANALYDTQLDVITDLPTMTADDLDADFAATYPQEFSLTIANPADGVIFDTPQLQYSLPTGTVLEYYNGSGWVTLAGPLDLPALAVDSSQTLVFRIAFPASGSQTVTFNLVDTHFTNILATLSQAVTVNPLYTVTGTFSMQGRSVRSGIPVALTMVSPAMYGPFDGITIDLMSGNLSITDVAAATYTITTNQPRYLNVTADLAKTKAVAGNTALAALELKGGNANWSNNAIDVNDASRIGTDWGGDVSKDGDVNFSGKVDIFDLALVGGNLDKSAADFYTAWLP